MTQNPHQIYKTCVQVIVYTLNLHKKDQTSYRKVKTLGRGLLLNQTYNNKTW